MGIVTVDDVIDIFREEATEDILKMAGVSGEEFVETQSVLRSTRIRLPWLFASCIGGVIAFAIGSIILMETDAPGFGIDIGVIVTFTLTSAGVFIFLVGMAIKARRRPVVSGMEQLVGSEAVALEDFDHKGQVMVHSETWQAKTDTPVQKDQTVDVIGIKGLTLKVKAKTVGESETEEKAS